MPSGYAHNPLDRLMVLPADIYRFLCAAFRLAAGEVLAYVGFCFLLKMLILSFIVFVFLMFYNNCLFSDEVVPVTSVQAVDFLLILLKVAHEHRVDIAAYGDFLVCDGVHYLGHDAVGFCTDVHTFPCFQLMPFEESLSVIPAFPLHLFVLPLHF